MTYQDQHNVLAYTRQKFYTENCSKAQLSLPEFSDQKFIKWLVYINDSTTDFNYKMIIGRDLLEKLDFILDFGAETMIWQDISVPMKNPDTSMEEMYHISNNPVNPEYDGVRQI